MYILLNISELSFVAFNLNNHSYPVIQNKTIPHDYFDITELGFKYIHAIRM